MFIPCGASGGGTIRAESMSLTTGEAGLYTFSNLANNETVVNVECNSGYYGFLRQYEGGQAVQFVVYNRDVGTFTPVTDTTISAIVYIMTN